MAVSASALLWIVRRPATRAELRQPFLLPLAGLVILLLVAAAVTAPAL
jgi:hypothetical protein